MRQILLLVAFAAPIMAQIPGNPRFHRGDDPRWADPAFDDRNWERVAERRAFTMAELAFNRQWIRMDVAVPAGRSELVVSLCSCEFFLNGVRVGATGNLDAAMPDANRRLMAFPVPEQVQEGPAILAIREYAPPGMEAAYSPSLQRASRVRLTQAAEADGVLLSLRRGTDLQIVPAILLLIVLTMVLATAEIRRLDRVSGVLSAYVILQVFVIVWFLQGPFTRTDWVLIWAAAIPNAPLVLGAMALASRLSLPNVLLGAYLIFHCAPRIAWVAGLLHAEPEPWTPTLSMIYIAQLAVAILIGFVIAAFARRRPEAPRLLLVAGLLVLSMNLLGRFAIAGGGIKVLGAHYSWDRVANLAFAVAAGSWVIRRERVRRSEEFRLKGEMEAAKSVQTMLLGQKLPEGVEAVYLPASEVGGDFYQAFATPRGRLILVGDVSGKDSSAAMTAAAITGAVRLLRSHGPARILTELNSVLDAHSGFVTCCCVLVEDDCVRAASAGHPAPYADGEEMALTAGLPLGMAADAEYEESRFPPPRVLTLISDGVVEAANGQGELFGFERTRQISTRPAPEIAEAARAWGQNDDITVVTVRRPA